MAPAFSKESEQHPPKQPRKKLSIPGHYLSFQGFVCLLFPHSLGWKNTEECTRFNSSSGTKCLTALWGSPYPQAKPSGLSQRSFLGGQHCGTQTIPWSPPSRPDDWIPTTFWQDSHVFTLWFHIVIRGYVYILHWEIETPKIHVLRILYYVPLSVCPSWWVWSWFRLNLS